MKAFLALEDGTIFRGKSFGFEGEKGGEVVFNGNDESESTATGMVLVWRPEGSSWSWGLKAGYRFQDYQDSPFAGFELGTAF